MKTPEDEAFDEIAKRQGGFQAKRAMAAAKLQEPVTEREALKLALEALEHISKVKCDHSKGVCTCEYREAADAIKAALAQPEQLTEKEKISREMTAEIVAARELAQPKQEPVATLWQHGETGRTRITMPNDITDCDARWFKAADLYTTPPQRTWVGLTDEEIKDIIGSWGDTPIKGYTRKLFDQIEAKLKEKNA